MHARMAARGGRRGTGLKGKGRCDESFGHVLRMGEGWERRRSGGTEDEEKYIESNERD